MSDANAPDERVESRPTARETAKAETRQALISAGITAFAEEGLDAPSLDSICKRAGKTRGAFYVHFKDRDDFLASIMELAIGGFADAIIATGDAAGDLQRTVRTFVGALGADGNLPIGSVIPMHQFMDACSRNPELQKRYNLLIMSAARRLARAVREGQAAGTVRNDIDAQVISLLLIALVVGVQVMASDGVPLPVKEAAEDLLRMLEPPKR